MEANSPGIPLGAGRRHHECAMGLAQVVARRRRSLACGEARAAEQGALPRALRARTDNPTATGQRRGAQARAIKVAALGGPERAASLAANAVRKR
eukprot:143245-Pyramimonas_sp.AAC.1